MSGEDILNALTNVENDYITKSWEETKTKKKLRYRNMRWAAVFVLVISLSGTMVVIATNIGPRLISTKSNEIESGYDVELNINRISSDTLHDPSKELNINRISSNKLHGSIKELKDVFIEQFQNYDIISNTYPGSYEKKFASLKEAIDYIGYKGLTYPNWERTPESIIVSVLGDEKGEICSVSLKVEYIEDDIRLQSFSNIYFTNYGEDPMMHILTSEYQKYENYSYSSKTDKEWLVIKSSPMKSGYLGMGAYATDNDVMYNLNVSYRKINEEKAQDIINDWMNAFSY